jgi:outer membrane protein OmpA-like peptidoglycan-associated protein
MNFSTYRAFFSFLMLVFASLHSSGQATQPGKALKYFEKAQAYFNKSEWNACENELNKVILADSTFAEAYVMLGDIFQEQAKLVEAADQYRKALQFKPEREDIVCNLLANTLFSLENYSEAIIYYQKVLDNQGISQDLRNSLEKKLKLSRVRKKLMENPVSFQPENLGNSVNTAADEYMNALAADGSGIFFTRKKKNEGTGARGFTEDFFYAARNADTFELARLLEYPPGKEGDAGAICISPDGRLLFFTSCFRSDSYGSCDLYYSEKKGDQWSPAKNMGPLINSESWDAQPSISPDGKTLYFSSSRPGGIGSSDIWKSERVPDGTWKKPVNLGQPVNTPGSEMAPFIHFDGQSLYFSSGGHEGMGGTDLFKATNINGVWSNPMNLGYPINSAADELIIVIDPKGDKGFISNNNLKGAGGYDIYSFELDTAIRPVAVTYLKGRVYDAVSGLPLEARFELIDLEMDTVIIQAISDRMNGEFLVCLPCNRNYALNVNRSGYLFYSDHFPLSDLKSSNDPVLKDIPLQPVEEGKKIVLRNIFFKTDEYQLEPESFPELEKLTEFLKTNPELKIEIGGHTDNLGTPEYNLDLSLKRAKAVVDYLVAKGIETQSIFYKGYGESVPVSDNEKEEGRALNRRTEVTILDSK